MNSRDHPGPVVAWAANLGVILLLSVFGRALQHMVAPLGLVPDVGYMVVGGLGLAIAAWLTRVAPHVPPARAALAVAAALAMFAWGLSLHHPEETVHLVLFGCLGLTATAAFGLRVALPVVAVCAGADELLQAWLPYRVGDWSDVGLDAASAMVGWIIGWAHAGTRREAGDAP